MRDEILKTLDEWFLSLSEEEMDKVVLHAGRIYTPREIISEIKNKTDFGLCYVDRQEELQDRMKQRDPGASVIKLISNSIRN